MLATPTTLSPLFALSLDDFFSDSRLHAYNGLPRNVKLQRASTSSGGAISKNEDGTSCVIAGKDSLRILRLSDPSQPPLSSDHRVAVGIGGHRIDASRNMWDGSGLKVDSASTDVAWAHGGLSNKVITSAKNGELILWDINKPGPNKYERRIKIHNRSINKLSVSHVVHYYCITGSTDGDLRVWDLRDMSKSVMRIHHSTSVRSVVFSPSVSHPLHAAVGLDNGSIFRWDLKMGQRGQLDRIPVAHSGPVMALDWCGASPGLAAHSSSSADGTEVAGGIGWIASGGLDRCVKVWDLAAAPQSRGPFKATYTLHPSFPVRRVVWRPGYECELAIVSNAEIGTGSDQGISYAMATKQRSPIISSTSDLGTLAEGTIGNLKEKRLNESRMLAGDPIEIWDVRRGWVAKWSVGGSLAEGGVTDFTFGDSHAIWAQHCSGSFSQLDLRDCTKPVDAIPHASATWEATGSLAFTVDKTRTWELPYDDVRPEARSVIQEGKIQLKALGDSRYLPKSQRTGVHAGDSTSQDLDAFTRLARAYLFKGDSRKVVCESNAKAAYEAGRVHAAQTWWLISSLLVDLIPEPPPSIALSPLPMKSPLSHMYSESTMSGSYTFPPQSDLHPDSHRVSPGRSSTHKSEPAISSSTSRKLTPTSSTSSSPRKPPSLLPPVAPRTSLLGRRPSIDANAEMAKRTSFYRRPSLSTHSASPSDRSIGSLRHVGEGALDDSDSSGSNSDRADAGSSDEESSLRPLISPALSLTTSRVMPAHPSPLSRVAGQQQWTDDERDHRHEVDDDETSPSPGSTDTESGGSTAPLRVHHHSPSANRRSGVISHKKTRSRSSTVASLAANTFTRTLVKQESHSSIRTVTAGDSSIREEDREKDGNEAGRYLKESFGNVRSLESAPVVPPVPPHQRQKSQATASDFVLNSVAASDGGDNDREAEVDPSKLSERNPLIVKADEEEIRELGWEVVREVLEGFADEGDSQMCAMLSIIAPKELRISKQRVVRFLESYIGTFLNHFKNSNLTLRKSRSSCPASAAHVCGVFAEIHRVRRRAIGDAAGNYHLLLVRAMQEAHSISCRSSESWGYAKGRVRILSNVQEAFREVLDLPTPVRALLFQCSVCNHGGHQECYRKYYMQRPMVESLIAPALDEERGRTLNREGSRGGGESDGAETDVSEETMSTNSRRDQQLFGHPCAAGCGHYCWAANESVDGGELE